MYNRVPFARYHPELWHARFESNSLERSTTLLPWGDNKCRIFFNDQDRTKFLSIYSEICARLHWSTYDWCLMGNHFHLVVETPEPNLSEGMRVLNGTYTQHVNREHGRTGHLFQGRFHSILVDRNPYLLEVIRYVVLNPVRTGLAVSP